MELSVLETPTWILEVWYSKVFRQDANIHDREQLNVEVFVFCETIQKKKVNSYMEFCRFCYQRTA